MSLKLIEAVIDVIKAYLETNMAAKLDELDTEYGDFVLADIDKYYVAELSAIPEYPSILILGESTRPVTEGAGWMNADHTLTVVALATDQDTERLRRRLYRYMRAIIELLVAARTSEGYVINIDGVEFSPLYGRSGTFLSDARVIIRLRKYETS